MDPEFWKELNFNKNHDQLIAEQVVTHRCKNQKQVFMLHGEKSQSKKLLNKYTGTSFDDAELYVIAGSNVVINGVMKRSYCLNGLKRNIVVFKNKVKHVMVRNCEDTQVFLENGTIAGIDVLYGSNVSLKTSKHNFTNIEYSNLTNLKGDIDNDSLIQVTKSLDVYVNQKNLMVNPFHTKPLKMVYQSNNLSNIQKPKKQKTNPSMSISPVSDSCFERWKTKLMLVGQDISSDTEGEVLDSSDVSSEDMYTYH